MSITEYYVVVKCDYSPITVNYLVSVRRASMAEGPEMTEASEGLRRRCTQRISSSTYFLVASIQSFVPE